MSAILNEYLSKRLNDINLNDYKIRKGPVITISRIAGCSSNIVSRQLAMKLNEALGEPKWKVISKEILHDSAIEMKLNPSKIKTIFEAKNRNILDEIVQTFISGDYQMEKKMVKTVSNVIHRFGAEGYKIIIGRAGNCICADIQQSLHVRLDAPLNWRIDRIEKTKKISKEEAINWINQTEKDRDNFRKSVKGKKVDGNDFDLIINQASFSDDEIVDIIINASKIKKIL
ncbi:MAG TPA: cytidylate kinase-like family protein [Prolixibacteraceae bacterium]|nr:cytidylate kinase-like family protein [Prolixibacteraceae bacterium]HPS11796.1 cytidylate kinase-like family protein [Prolixibacteraceae bacterium]